MSLYDFSVLDENHNPVSMSRYKNKVIIVVNTASLCGYTPQYKELEILYQKYKQHGLVILAFPCNQFRNEDPDPIQVIIKNVRDNYGVTFPIFDKIRVNGRGSSEFFNFLKASKPGNLGFKGIYWNFEKFIIDTEGKVRFRFPSEVNPLLFERHIQILLGLN